MLSDYARTCVRAYTCARACMHAASGDACGESTWPDLDAQPINNNGVCGACKVLVDSFDKKYGTCRKYCETIGRDCVGQWEEEADTCMVKTNDGIIRNCDYPEQSSDAICECSGTVRWCACVRVFVGARAHMLAHHLTPCPLPGWPRLTEARDDK